jgi:hypothetical protein
VKIDYCAVWRQKACRRDGDAAAEALRRARGTTNSSHETGLTSSSSSRPLNRRRSAFGRAGMADLAIRTGYLQGRQHGDAGDDAAWILSAFSGRTRAVAPLARLYKPRNRSIKPSAGMAMPTQHTHPLERCRVDEPNPACALRRPAVPLRTSAWRWAG